MAEVKIQGVRQGCRTLTKGQESPFRQPPSKARNAGIKRQPGRLFFGYFLLATQKKVSRFRVREPDQINRRGSDTLLMLLAGFFVGNVGLHCIQPKLRTGDAKAVGYAPRTIFKFSDELNPKRYAVRTFSGFGGNGLNTIGINIYFNSFTIIYQLFSFFRWKEFK
jgi:hypothetical protein